MLIDSIERLEFPLAHAIPETTSNVLIPISITALLFVKDWRLALAVFIPAAVTLLIYLPMYIGIMNDFAAAYYTALENMNSRVISPGAITALSHQGVRVLNRTNSTI